MAKPRNHNAHKLGFPQEYELIRFSTRKTIARYLGEIEFNSKNDKY